MEDRETFHQMDGEGNIQEIDVLSGELISSNTLSKIAKSPWVYSQITAEIICQKIADGMTLSKICRMDGFPNMGVIIRWKSEEDDFDSAITLAEKARAERYTDKIDDSLEDTRKLGKDQIAAEKLYFDKLKHLAKVNDRKKYGERDQKIIESGANVIIQISTGIDRGIEHVPSEVMEVVKQQELKKE